MKTYVTSIVAALALHCLAPHPALAQSARAVDRTLQLTTSASLLVTATLGTFVAMNQPTLFSEGKCAAGHPVLGSYGCQGLNPLHGLSAIVSLVLYTATETLEFARFDWPGRNPHGAGFDALSYVHLVGMALQPIGGLLAAVPSIVGAPRNGLFSRVLRTIHIVTGYAIVSSFLITTGIEL